MINKTQQILEGLCMHTLLDKTNVHDRKITLQTKHIYSNPVNIVQSLSDKSHSIDTQIHMNLSDDIIHDQSNIATQQDASNTQFASIPHEQNIIETTTKRNTNKSQSNTDIHNNALIEALEHVKTLDDLAQAIQNTSHPFEQFSKRLVFGDGIRTAQVMIIGEAPGADEDEQQKPFVGQSGVLLMDILKTINLERHKNFYITNIIPWRPPFNQTPTLDEIKYFLPYIKKHIELINPKMLILIGATAYKALSLISSMDHSKTITQIHGQILDIEMQFASGSTKLQACVLLHPSYLLRLPSQKKNMWRDVIGLEKMISKY